MPTLVLLCTLLSGSAAPPNDEALIASFLQQEEEFPRFGLHVGTLAVWSRFDDNSLLGSGVALGADFRITPFVFVFAEFRAMRLQDDPIFLLAFVLPLAAFGFPVRDDELTAYDLFGGVGARLPIADWLDFTARLGIGFERYSAERTETVSIFGFGESEQTFKTDGNAFLLSLDAALAFRLADWLDLETGFTLGYVRRKGFDGEGENDAIIGATLGVAFRF